MNVFARCGLVFVAIIAGRFVEAQPAPSPDFRALLQDAGVEATQLEGFRGWDGGLERAQAEALREILFRLQQLDDGRIEVDPAPVEQLTGDDQTGRLFRVEGAATAFRILDGFSMAARSTQDEGLWMIEVKPSGGAPAMIILSAAIPREWRSRPADQPVAEPVQCSGVLIGSVGAGLWGEANEGAPLLLARRVKWYPESGVAAGVAWLVRQGYNAALLDSVRHGRPFSNPGESREPEAFYGCLAAASKGSAAELRRLARSSIDEQSAEWTRAASAPGASSATKAIAAQVADRAKLGVSSVWPLFKQPQNQVGQAVLIEGVARRAVRVIASAGAATRGGAIDAYYEVDVYTADSQNLPVICCVARLPAGFPTGDQIREPVRVAGVFFKRWAYVRRTASEDNPALPKRLAPPLVIAAEPEWLSRSGRTEGNRGLWAAAALAVVLAAGLFALARVSKRDRLARARRVRYDEPPDRLPEL